MSHKIKALIHEGRLERDLLKDGHCLSKERPLRKSIQTEEEKKKRQVSIKLEGSDIRDGEVVRIYYSHLVKMSL